MKIEYSHSPFSICCILSEYVKRRGEFVMAISTQVIELNDPLRNIVADSTAVFDELSSKQTGYGSGDGLNVASKLDDAEDDDEDDDDEEEEDEDFDEEGDDEEDEDDEEEDEDEDEEDEDEDEDDDDEDDDEDEVPVPKRR
jgi:hypothetical protein